MPCVSDETLVEVNMPFDQPRQQQFPVEIDDLEFPTGGIKRAHGIKPGYDAIDDLDRRAGTVWQERIYQKEAAFGHDSRSAIG